MTLSLSPSTFEQFALFTGLITLFSGVVIWAVKAVVDTKINSVVTKVGSDLSSQNAAIAEGLKALQDHIDEKFNELETELQAHDRRLDAHDEQITNQKIATLKLRNEMLESMRDNYVRREDLAEIKQQIGALFRKLDAFFGMGGGNGRA